MEKETTTESPVDSVGSSTVADKPILEPEISEKDTTEHRISTGDQPQNNTAQTASNEVDKQSFETAPVELPSAAISENVETQSDAPSDDWEYITGFKLFIVLAALTVTCFLMMLDTSVIVTVSEAPTKQISVLSTYQTP